ncbi:hypothetical protein LS74_009755 [Helicobacter magdeburgensis]|uniref:Uncharacterized protein n=1 Tax=Helicobacter magdeburgensis TaxID=471858 RepID=A0A4U8SW81_9HELI|nr:hypothetical protein [Helicobacter magdeburgensis]TLD91200.1 hypothetical protein LS74_009755 [Helicobacter magdeburgensis]
MNEVSFFWKFLIALCAGVFGVAVAISIQHIKIIGVPKWLIVFAIVVQLLLSWGVFIFIIIFFKSGLLPKVVPNDDYSALSVAYFCASIPHIVITTAILIYNKEINKWLESRYGSGETLPNMDNVATSKSDVDSINTQESTDSNHSGENTQDSKTEDEVSLRDLETTQESKVCETCGKTL